MVAQKDQDDVARTAQACKACAKSFASWAPLPDTRGISQRRWPVCRCFADINSDGESETREGAAFFAWRFRRRHGMPPSIMHNNCTCVPFVFDCIILHILCGWHHGCVGYQQQTCSRISSCKVQELYEVAVLVWTLAVRLAAVSSFVGATKWWVRVYARWMRGEWERDQNQNHTMHVGIARWHL